MAARTHIHIHIYMQFSLLFSDPAPPPPTHTLENCFLHHWMVMKLEERRWLFGGIPEETTDLRQVTDESFHTYGLWVSYLVWFSHTHIAAKMIHTRIELVLNYFIVGLI